MPRSLEQVELTGAPNSEGPARWRREGPRRGVKMPEVRHGLDQRGLGEVLMRGWSGLWRGLGVAQPPLADRGGDGGEPALGPLRH